MLQAGKPDVRILRCRITLRAHFKEKTVMRPNLLVAATLFTSTNLLFAAEPDGSGLSTQEVKEGFVALFDGKTHDGWQGATKGYTVEDGKLVIKQHGGGNLFTAKEFSDFIFRFEFKLPPGGNNGVGIRSPLKGNPAYAAMEIQILDDPDPRYKNIKDYQHHGSIYGVVPAKQGHLKPTGQWNSEEIMCKGPRVRVTLNGTVIVDADVAQVKPIDGHAHPGLTRAKGHIGFLGHGAGVQFRNIRIKELTITP